MKNWPYNPSPPAPVFFFVNALRWYVYPVLHFQLFMLFSYRSNFFLEYYLFNVDNDQSKFTPELRKQD